LGLDINRLSLIAAMLAGARLTGGFEGFKLTASGVTYTGDRLTLVATWLMNNGYIRNVKRGLYGVTEKAKTQVLGFNVPAGGIDK
jgi:hypothetical protein